MSVNDRILNNSILQNVLLQQFNNFEVNKILGIFNDDILPDLVGQLEKRFAAGKTNWTTQRIASMRDIIKKTMDLRPMYKANKADLSELAIDTSKQLANVLNAEVAAVGLEAFAPATQQLRSMVVSDPFEGATLREWYGGLQSDAQRNITRQLTIGIGEGETVRQMTDRITGTAGEAFTDGAAEVVRRHAATIVRTATNHVNSQARIMTAQENADVVKGMEFVATLDSKTTEICMQYDGQVWDLDDPALQEPPLHFNCRSTIVPVTKSFEELGINLKEAPEGTRAAFDGQVPASKNYESWLKDQTEQVQNSALGVTRAQMWRRGDIKIGQFTNDFNQKLTLKQLRAKGYNTARRTGSVSETGKPVSPATGKQAREMLATIDDKYLQKEKAATKSIQSVKNDLIESNRKLRELEWGSKEWRKENERNEALFQKQRGYVSELNKIESNKLEAMRKQVIYQNPPADVSVNVRSTKFKGKPLLMDNIDKGVDAFNKIIGSSANVGGTVTPLKMIPKNKDSYAYYSPSEKSVNFIPRSLNPRVICHEMAHMVEDKDKRYNDACVRFFNKRTAGEELRNMKKDFPDKRYNGDEYYKVDKWTNPYMGRWYDDGTTELFSSGIENMYANPIKFASSDPEYFDFIFDLTRGIFEKTAGGKIVL